MSLIMKAAALAKQAHAGMKRKYNDLPYIVHPARVAGRVAVLSDVTQEMVAAAFLHDVLEDTAVTVEEIEAQTNAQVAFYVDWMTNKPKNVNLPRAERKAMDRERLAGAPREVKLIKMVDRIDNLREMTQAPGAFRVKYGEESLLLAEVLKDADTDLAQELLAEARASIQAGMESKDLT